MNKLTSLALASALLIAPVCSMADDLKGVYLGGHAAAYFLDNERFIAGEDDDELTGGIQLGYRYDNPLAVEIGVGSGGDLDTFKIDGFYYLNRSESGWAPYFVLGYTRYNFDDDDGVLADSDDSTGQLDAGFGFSKMSQDSQWEFRADGRFLERMGSGDQATDLALTMAVNYYFEKAEEPAPVVEPAPAPPPEPEMRTITVQLNVLFEFDKAVVRAIYGDELLAVANAMKVHEDIELALEGHTDSKGSDEYNQGLSLRRVEAVKAKLQEVYGIPGHRITTIGYGESRPIADNSTAEGRAMNRRVIGELTYQEVVSP